MSRLAKILTAAIACCAFVLPGSAGAATVVNGDFETGDLGGWQTNYQTGCGEFRAYPRVPDDGVFTIQSGSFAAGSYQGCPDSLVLYQDVALEPYWTHKLSAFIAYESEDPIFVPTPNTFTVDSEGAETHNQQLRIDVIKPGADLRTVNPGDILATLFANKTGDPETLPPTAISADLTPFAGQTVRIRVIQAVHDGPYYIGTDAYSIASTPPSNVFVKGAVKKNKKKGTASLQITVPAPGTVTAGLKKKIKATTVQATAAGLVTIPLKAVGKGAKALRKKGKLTAKVPVTFTPSGGTAATQTFAITLKKKTNKK